MYRSPRNEAADSIAAYEVISPDIAALAQGFRCPGMTETRWTAGGLLIGTDRAMRMAL